MVNARTYPLWRDLATSEDLPKEALKTVIEALCAPAKSPHGFDARADQWREEALRAALPALLGRTSAKRLRSQLLVHADEKMLATLAAEGTVTVADVPAILRHRRAWAGLISGLARHPGQVEAAIALLPRLVSHEVERVVGEWDLDRYTRTEGDPSAPPLPRALFDAVLEACLTPLAAYLLYPEPEEGWEAVSTGRTGRWNWATTAPGRCWPGVPSGGRSSPPIPRSEPPSNTCCWTRPRSALRKTPGSTPPVRTRPAKNPPLRPRSPRSARPCCGPASRPCASPSWPSCPTRR